LDSSELEHHLVQQLPVATTRFASTIFMLKIFRSLKKELQDRVISDE